MNKSEIDPPPGWRSCKIIFFLCGFCQYFLKFSVWLFCIVCTRKAFPLQCQCCYLPVFYWLTLLLFPVSFRENLPVVLVCCRCKNNGGRRPYTFRDQNENETVKIKPYPQKEKSVLHLGWNSLHLCQHPERLDFTLDLEYDHWNSCNFMNG